MPQSSQLIGVNSVTNIELDAGDMPAPVIRNADWFKVSPGPNCCPLPVAQEVMSIDA